MANKVKNSNKKVLNEQSEKRIELVGKFIGNAKLKIILDIGVNNLALSDTINAKKVLKLDIVKEANPDLICDLNRDRIPLNNEEVDIVIAGEVMEHLNNPYRTAREFHRVLKRKGILIVTVPNVCSFVNRIKMLFGQLPAYCSIAWDSEHQQDPEKHQNDFNLKSICEVLTVSGFDIEDITSNGIVTHSKILLTKCPPSLGEVLIIKAKKN